MWLDKQIMKYREELTRSDLEVLEALRTLSEDISDQSITTVAKKLHTSKSSLSRLAQRLGFLGYAEFKYQWHQHYQKDSEKLNIYSPTEILALLEKDVSDTFRLASKTDFSPLVELIQRSGIVYCYGTGHSQRKALEEFSRLLITIDKRAIVIPVEAELRMTVPMITSSDVLLVCSVRGEVPEIYDLLLEIKKKGTSLLALTQFSQNPLEEIADFSSYFFSTSFTDNKKVRDRFTLTGLTSLLDYIYRICFIDYLSNR